MFTISVSPELQTAFAESTAGFEAVLALKGDIYREVESRRTLRFEQQGQGYFAKLHFGVGWLEIIKNLLAGRLPIIGAKTEYLAIKHLQALQISTMKIAGFGEQGYNPATRRSFLITHEVTKAVGLNDYCRDWSTNPPSFTHKKQLIEKLAMIVGKMHDNGLNHRDCYLCHFYLYQDRMDLCVMDLHRSQIRRVTPQRWREKDVSGLYFSAMDIGLTKRDLYRFMKIYTRQSLRDCLAKETAFWQAVDKRAKQLYQKESRRG